MALLKPLKRGGYVLTFNELNNFILQFVAPPETSKDSLIEFSMVPGYFILPKNLIDKNTFLNNAEIEFPIYYNFFAKQQQTHIICTEEQKSIMQTVLKESLFGPENPNYAEDDFRNSKNYHFDLNKEAKNFAGYTLGDCVKFHVFDKNNRVSLENGLGVHVSNDNELKFFLPMDANPLIIKDPDKNIVNLPYRYLNNNVLVEEKKNNLTHFSPPKFGFTCLGSSNGFDPAGSTSGFILWLNGSGILIDPPANAITWLEKDNLSFSLISGILLTHCHADHDAGILQNIMKGNRIPIYTTVTIWESFKRKYINLLSQGGFDEDTFNKMCDFIPVYIDEALILEDAEISFNYSLHTIPTINISVKFENKSLFYSSDTFFAEKTYDMVDKQIISTDRYYGFIDDFKNHDVIIHETGGGVIHSTFSMLDKVVPKNKKVYTYHCSKAEYDAYINENPKCSFIYPKVGLSETVSLLKMPKMSCFDFLSSFKLFEDLSSEKIKTLSENAGFKSYYAHEEIITQGDEGDDFFIIRHNWADVFVDNVKIKKYISYDFFGETSSVRDSIRTATVKAGESGCECLKVKGKAFKNILEDTQLWADLYNLNHVRDKGSFDLVSNSSCFTGFTSAMKVYFQMKLKYQEYHIKELGEEILSQEKLKEYGYFLVKGEVKADFINHKKDYFISEYSFLGDIRNLLFDTELKINKICAESEIVRVFAISKADLQEYFKNYPIIYPRLNYSF